MPLSEVSVFVRLSTLPAQEAGQRSSLHLARGAPDGSLAGSYDPGLDAARPGDQRRARAAPGASVNAVTYPARRTPRAQPKTTTPPITPTPDLGRALMPATVYTPDPSASSSRHDHAPAGRSAATPPARLPPWAAALCCAALAHDQWARHKSTLDGRPRTRWLGGHGMPTAPLPADQIRSAAAGE